MAKVGSRFISILLFYCSIALSSAEYMPYLDPKQPVEARVGDLLKRMSLAEKIGQMTQIERVVAKRNVMRDYFIGSVLSGGGSVPKRHATPEMWVDLVNHLQNASLSTPLKIPMFYATDAIHGHNNAYGATIFPHNIGLGATRDPELVKRIGVATALEVRATGIQYTFAPCIAVCRDPRWGRCYESYSEDPQLVRNMTRIIPGLQGDIPANSTSVPYIDGHGQQTVVAAAKHFAGDGGTTNGTNEGNAVGNWIDLFRIHLLPYLDAIRNGVGSVMVSYSSWNGVKMHANRNLITNFLKNKLHFKGFVISDYQGIDKITDPPHENYTYSILAGVGAGIDMIMVPFNYTEFISGLTDLVEKKYILMDRINDAVGRILRVKFTMGLFENPFAGNSSKKYLGCQEHRDLAREAVRKSLVLLKNGNSLLPLPKKTAKKILVAGSHANDIGNQCGGWTISWQGQSGAITPGTTILEGIKKTVNQSTKVDFRKNPSKETLKSNHYSYAIVVVGEPPYAETAGDSTNLTLPDSGVETIKNVCLSIKCVVVLVTGRPVVIQPYLRLMDALVAAWLPGTEGQGVADVLFGDYGFSGKLSRTWFRNVSQLPMNFGDKNYDPLFAYGFGLTTKGVNG